MQIYGYISSIKSLAYVLRLLVLRAKLLQLDVVFVALCVFRLKGINLKDIFIIQMLQPKYNINEEDAEAYLNRYMTKNLYFIDANTFNQPSPEFDKSREQGQFVTIVLSGTT